MSAVVVGSSTVVPKASKPKRAKKAQSHPSYSGVIGRAVSELKQKSSLSRAAILKFTLSHYKLGDKEAKHVGEKPAARKHAKKPDGRVTKLNSKEPRHSGIKRKKLKT